MRVLFTHSYFLKFDNKQYRTAMPYPPLATLYAMAYLRENGFHVKLFDTMFADSAHDIRPTIEQYKPDILVIYDDGFNYLTKMCLTNMREAAFDMQTYAKSQGCRVITSSSDATDHGEKYLEHGADYIIIGEAEQTLLEICQLIQNKSEDRKSLIAGLAYAEEHQVLKTPKRAVIKDLDTLPHPAWDLLDIEPYKAMWMQHHGYFSLNFVTTRGCPYKCNWCAKPIYGNRYNSHSAENIVREIKTWQQKFGFTHVWFADDIFGLKPAWLHEFAEAVDKEQLKIRYKIQSRADLLLEENNIEHLAKSGCDMVWMGAESGSQKILDAMDKGTKVEQIYEASRLLKKHHIHVALFLQFGYPGETLDDIRKTMDMVNDILPDDIGASVSYPLPGTKFYDTVKEQLKTKTNWTDSDDLDLMFKNTYSKEFYKELHRYIHIRYRIRRGLHAMRLLFTKPSLYNAKQVAALLRLIPQKWIWKQKLKTIEPGVATGL